MNGASANASFDWSFAAVDNDRANRLRQLGDEAVRQVYAKVSNDDIMAVNALFDAEERADEDMREADVSPTT